MTLERSSPLDARAIRTRQGQEAVSYYERVQELGILDPEKRDFLLSLGSSLRNLGRAKDAVALLAEANDQYPGSPDILAFLSGNALSRSSRPRSRDNVGCRPPRRAARRLRVICSRSVGVSSGTRQRRLPRGMNRAIDCSGNVVECGGRDERC